MKPSRTRLAKQSTRSVRLALRQVKLARSPLSIIQQLNQRKGC